MFLSILVEALNPKNRYRYPPFFLWGSSGRGRIDQAVEELGTRLAVVQTNMLDDIDFHGVPFITEDGQTTWSGVSDIFPTKGEGVLLFDNLPTAKLSVMTRLLHIAIDHRIEKYILPFDWSVICTGDREVDNAGLHRIPADLVNRFTHINLD